MRERARSINNTTDFLITPKMYAPLETSLVLRKGAGGPTWSRTTKAWGFNELGYLEELASGCAFFGGARLVRNFIRNSALDNAVWTNTGLTITAGQTDYLGGTSAFLLMETAETSNHDIRDDGVSAGAGRVMVICVVAKANGRDQIRISDNAYGAVLATFDLSAGTSVSTAGTSTITSLGGGYYKCIAKTSGSLANNQFYPRIYIYNGGVSYAGGITKGVILSHVQVSSVTNYDASYIPEYVSVGVSRNEIINTEDPSNASWTMVGGIGTKTAIITDGPTGKQINVCQVTVGVSTTGLRIQGSGTVTSGAKISGSVWVRKISGSGTQITMDLNDAGSAAFTINSVWQKIQLANISHGSVAVKFIDISISTATWTTGDIIEVCYPQYNYGSTLNDYTVVGGSYVYDGAGIDGAKYFSTDYTGGRALTNLIGFRREASATNNLLHSRDLSNAAWSTKTNITAGKTATGLDGIANTATTLTAGAADATILQSITLASAARCASAYVKRRTGTGTISFTQDGTNWTDITAQINSSTWSRVQITSTLANPSVGFKISTSGDAIDVDCVQNEAGAVATSPIVTTTAAVTRDADSLTYQTAGNIDFAVGTLYCKAQFASSLTTRRAIIVGSDGYSYINVGDANTLWKAYDGTNLVTKSGLSDISTEKRKRAIAWGTGLKVTGDGLSPASGSFDGSFGGASAIEIGQNINGYIGPVAIYNYQMTDAELQEITK